MSDQLGDAIEDSLRERGATLATFGGLAAMQQRSQLIANQQKAHEEMQRHTKALQDQNRIERDRAKTEAQRLEIEQRRLKADEAERELRRLQAEQVRQLRNLMADLDTDVAQFRKVNLSP